MRTKYDFSSFPLRADWAFSNTSQAETHRGTHIYHSYPMRFIPQLAEALVREYSGPQSLICDPFMGSGTTLIESVRLGRNAVGVDVNPLTKLIAEAKTTAIDPEHLRADIQRVESVLASEFSSVSPIPIPSAVMNRLKYWHPYETLLELSKLIAVINETSDLDSRRLLLCGFSQILKQSSYWWAGSTRAIRSTKRTRVPQDPRKAFVRHLRLMAERNRSWWVETSLGTSGRATAEVGDARALPYADGSIDTVITSPPYVTSYDYAELHQLSLLWLGYVSSYQELRPMLIGSQYGTPQTMKVGDFESVSPTATTIVESLAAATRHKFLIRAVARYFDDMWKALGEMARVIKPGGQVVLVVGNTKLRGVTMKNAEVLGEMLDSHGLRLTEVLRRPIPVKSIPKKRDSGSGQFTVGKGNDPYAEEYVLVFTRP